MKRLLFCFLALMSFHLLSQIATAGTKTFIKEYSYQAGEADSKLSCRIIAIEQTKRLLLEELGTYLKSNTEVKNLQISADQITVLTAGIVKTEIINEKWDGKTYNLNAKITVDPDNVAKEIEFMRNDARKTKELEEAHKKIEEALLEITRLKKELALKKGNRETNKQSYKAAIKDLNTTNWKQRGFELLDSKKFDESIEAFNNAIELNPDDTAAYMSLGSLYTVIGRYKDSIEMFTKGINLKPEDIYRFYMLRAGAYSSFGKYRQAIQDFEKAIELNPDDASSYQGCGLAYGSIGNWNQAIHYLDRAITLSPDNAGFYFSRGLIYINSKNEKRGVNDVRTAAKLGLKEAQKYLQDRGNK